MSLPPEYGHTLESPASTLVGQHIGNFLVRELIGEGAMGTVYLGTHDTLDRRVAIKVLRPELAANESLVHRFIDEARAASSIGHPGLVQIFDFGVLSDGRRYSVMEFLPGHDLETAIERDGVQDIGRAAAIGAEVASALAAAHAKGIIHRDLKPANLFLSRDETNAERIKVLDFGIAKLLAGETARTQAGHIVGTPEYMAPEQAQAKANVDHRVDIYALGCVLYELLVGEPPFVADNIPTILVAQLQEVPVPPSRRRRDIPPAMDSIVLRCLAKLPQERFQSMEEVRGALLPYVDSSIAPPRRNSRALPPQTAPAIQAVGGRRLWLVALVVLLIGAAAVIAMLVLAPGGDETASLALDDRSAVAAEPADAAAPETTAAAANNPYNVTNDVAVAGGKALYVGHCARCHGEHGEGDGAEAEANNPPKSFAGGTDDGLMARYHFEAIRVGVPDKGMPPFADKLSVDETWKLVTYVQTLAAAKDADPDKGLDTRQPKTTAAIIKRGKVVFDRECRSCHGKDGKGKGPAAEYLTRLPTNLTRGIFKLRSTPKDSLPLDSDIYRTITKGVGTGIMPGFPRIHPQDRWAIVAYIKTLSARFAKETPGEAAEVPPRPRPSAESIDRGRSVFQMNGCPKCHGSEGLGKDATITGLTDKRGNVLDPPDFSDRFDFLSGTDPEDVWRTMWTGLSGVEMPMGRTLMNETDAWDVVNWMLSLQNR